MKKKLLAIIAMAAMIVTMIPSVALAETNQPAEEDFGKISLFIDDVEQETEYDSFKAAIAAANEVDLLKSVRLECEAGKLIPNGDNHISVTRTMTINGNGATQVCTKNKPSAEATFAIEQYAALKGDTALNINKLKNATVWGTRNTAHKFTLNMIDCDTDSAYATGQRIYINGSTGENHITIKDCDFNGNAGNCVVYSNAAGKVIIEDCTFEEINEPININTKAVTGSVKVSVKNTGFKDCGFGDKGDAQWAAPIRVVNSGNIAGGSQVAVDGCDFEYSEGKQSANGDILIGDGRSGKTSYDIKLDLKNTGASDSEAEVMIQYPGYYNNSGEKDESKAFVHYVDKNDQKNFSINVAKINDKEYASLADAISNAKEGDTVVLLTDISAEVWNQIWKIKGITVDGNGKIIKVKKISSLENHDAILHSAGNNVFKNIVFDLTEIEASKAQGNRAISASAGDIISNVTILGNDKLSYGITCGGTDAIGETVIIEACEFKNCNYGVYDSEQKSVENLIIKDSVFDECNYATILRSENGEFTGNTVINGKLNIMSDKQTVISNKFQDESRIKFYASKAEFKNNQISKDSYLDFDEDLGGTVDVSQNYWGGEEPTADQLGNDVSKVTGADVYYLKETMNPEDLNTYKPETPEKEDKPDGATQTGDDFNMAIPIAAAGIAIAAMAAVIATRKRHN